MPVGGQPHHARQRRTAAAIMPSIAPCQWPFVRANCSLSWLAVVPCRVCVRRKAVGHHHNPQRGTPKKRYLGKLCRTGPLIANAALCAYACRANPSAFRCAAARSVSVALDRSMALALILLQTKSKTSRGRKILTRVRRTQTAGFANISAEHAERRSIGRWNFAPAIIGVAYGAIEGKESLSPVAVVWTDHKAPWVALPPELPKLARQN